MNELPSVPETQVQGLTSVFQLNDFFKNHSEGLGFSPKFRSAVDVIPLAGNKKITSKQVFVKRAGYYIVPLDGEFFYYPCKVYPLAHKEASFYRMVSLPGTLLEGFVVVDKSVFYVTFKDLQKGVVRVSRKVDIFQAQAKYKDFVDGTAFQNPRAVTAELHPVNGGVQAQEGGAPNQIVDLGAQAVRGDSVNRSVGGSDSMAEEAQFADMALQEQISALLDYEDPEEGQWEVSFDPQS